MATVVKSHEQEFFVGRVVSDCILSARVHDAQLNVSVLYIENMSQPVFW